jgi:hypothetical protein
VHISEDPWKIMKIWMCNASKKNTEILSHNPVVLYPMQKLVSGVICPVQLWQETLLLFFLLGIMLSFFFFNEVRDAASNSAYYGYPSCGF